MNWKLKALILNGIAALPEPLSYRVYFFIQRRFGALRKVTPIKKFRDAIEIWNRILAQQQDPRDKVFLEVGTGRAPMVPVGLWLMGAAKIITIDLNPFVERAIVRGCLDYVKDNEAEVRSLFGSLLNQDRFSVLLEFARNTNGELGTLLEVCNIEYRAPSDAAKTELQDGCINYHVSVAVFEHIDPDALMAILSEGRRVLASGGLFVHRVDYGDHFTHSDQSITTINFLRYSQEEWNRYGGNRFVYQNRLWHDDFLRLFEREGHELMSVSPKTDPKAAKALENNEISLHADFKTKPISILSVKGAWFVTGIARS